MAQTVLVIEDEPNILLSLRYLMERAGYHVDVARDGDEAMAALDGDLADLVLLDVMLPKRDGYEICRMMRDRDGWRTVPVIMLSARGREDERVKGMAAGATDYIVKPFSTKEVVARVGQLLSDQPDAEEG